uniref:Uncharacterized protein n=1 Tax=Avena sativa TaxID=4498 RepID=A0ACD5WMS9_AVESA
MWMTIVTLLLTMAAVLLFSMLSSSPQRLPPGPATVPVLGNMHQMLCNKQPVFRWIHRLLKEMGTDILCLRLGPVHVITVASPEIAREVLQKKDAVLASRPTSFSAELLSIGYKNIVKSPYGDQWRKMRHVVSSEILSPSMELRMHGRRVEVADHLVSYVHSQCGSVVDVRYVARHFCGNMIRMLMFGKRHFSGESTTTTGGGGGPGKDEEAHVDALITAVDYAGAFCVSDYFPVLVGLDLQGHEKVIRDVMSTLRRLYDPLIQDRIRKQSANDNNGGERRPPQAMDDFLDVLVSLEDAQGQPLLTATEITALAIDLTTATPDNTSSAVEWALAEMVNQPDVMRKAMAELDSVVGRDRLVQESDIRHLNYLKACIKEALRIHPYHAFSSPHVATADTTLAGYFVPKGSHVLISRFGLGRNPKVWDDPLEFRPERHHPSSSSKKVDLTEPDLRFITFSTGRRSCPAISLATSITMMLFARLLQGFIWTTPSGVGRIELQDSPASLALSKPLLLEANPRLPPHLYVITPCSHG